VATIVIIHPRQIFRLFLVMPEIGYMQAEIWQDLKFVTEINSFSFGDRFVPPKPSVDAMAELFPIRLLLIVVR
jgi:hypothetical protein